jgi:hypothetical protein
VKKPGQRSAFDGSSIGFGEVGQIDGGGDEMGSEGSKRRVYWMSTPDGRRAAGGPTAAALPVLNPSPLLISTRQSNQPIIIQANLDVHILVLLIANQSLTTRGLFGF